MTDTMTQAWIAPATPPPTAEDLADVRSTVLDYFEGWFDADVERMRRALHAGLAKRSLAQDRDRTPAVSSVTAEQMLAWTASGYGRARDSSDRTLDVQVVDVSGTIAMVLVHSNEYVEYLHLVRTADGWRIVNALWRYADGRGPAA